MKTIELINASAGSGKTYRLAERVLEEVAKSESRLSPERLMATTFTKKAAAELRERLRLRLLADGREDDARKLLEGFVGTVNSVCARLLREYAFEAGLSPAVEVLPEEEEERLFRIAIENVVERHAPEIEPAAKRLGHDGTGYGFQQQPDWRSEVQEIVKLARANGMQAVDLQRSGEQSWASYSPLLDAPVEMDHVGNLLRSVRDLHAEIEAITDAGGETTKTFERLQDFLQAHDRGDIIQWKDFLPLAKAKTTNRDGVDISELTLLASRVLVNPRFHADLKDFITGVFDCAADALMEYDAYKRIHGLMDYTDQEEKVLQLALGEESFRNSMQERLDHLMVDEFQDTSPIQLALFLQLHQLAGKTTWVGDPKQSIYKFRGSDPRLMEQAAKQVGRSETLEYSWRSRQQLVKLTNTVFTRGFHRIPREQIELRIPDARAEAAVGGWIEQWQLLTKNKPGEAAAVAAGVREQLIGGRRIKPSNIAVLCRKNEECANIAAELEAIGVRASVPYGDLLSAREVQLAVAGLRYVQDAYDTLALAEIVHLSPYHGSHKDWLQAAVAAGKDVFDTWKQDPMIGQLDALRRSLHHRTPMEILEMTLDALHMSRTVAVWSRSALRISNLDALRGACVRYYERSRIQHGAATLAGLLAFLKDNAGKQASASGEDTVQVLTYHTAKGLEWPVVVLTSLGDTPSRRLPSLGVHVDPASEFDPRDPLAGRSIRFWPAWYFGNTKFEAFEQKIVATVQNQAAQEEAEQEAQRLLYVGMTRARDGLVFAIRKEERKTKTTLKTGWLDLLTNETGKPVLAWPLDRGSQTLHIDDENIPIEVLELSPENEVPDEVVQNESVFVSPEPVSVASHKPARMSPSAADEEMPVESIEFQEFAVIGDRISIEGTPDMRLIGNVIHTFFAADDPGSGDKHRTELAERILKNWAVAEDMTPQKLLLMSDRLWKFINERWPNAKVHREYPVSLRKGDILTQGWIDILIETDAEYVVIDHKIVSIFDMSKVIQNYMHQMLLYKEALRQYRSVSVYTMMHLPMHSNIQLVVLK